MNRTLITLGIVLTLLGAATGQRRANAGFAGRAFGTRNEVGAPICRSAVTGQRVFGRWSEGTPMSVQIDLGCPAGHELEGLYHTHPGGVPYPSETDLRSGRSVKAQTLCVNADGDLRCYRP